MRDALRRPIVLRGGIELAHPLESLLPDVEGQRWFDASEGSGPAAFAEADLRLANRGGARISGAEIEAILGRRRAIAQALHELEPDASLAARSRAVPWAPLERLFRAFADIRGVGLSKATKSLHRKRPALIPILDSVVQAYLHDDDPGAGAAFEARALALVRGYKRDVDRNRAALRALRQELARRGHALSEVRILDLLIWSAVTAG